MALDLACHLLARHGPLCADCGLGRAMTNEQFLELEHVHSTWRAAADNGFLIVACLSGTKVPLGNEWQRRSRRGEYVRIGPAWHARNGGILLDGLRGVDFDVDDPYLVAVLRALSLDTFGGDPPTRYRCDSPRELALYRATEGAPPTHSIKGERGGIQVLGRDHHCLAFGRHPDGADLRWHRSPVEVAVDDLGEVREAQVHHFLREAATLIEAPEPRFQIPSASAAKSRSVTERRADPRADLPDIARVRDALSRIPVPAEFDSSNRIAMALFAATGGSEVGLEALIQWRAGGTGFDEAKVRARWQHYHRSPPTSLTAGTLFHAADHADQARLAGFLDLGLGR